MALLGFFFLFAIDLFFFIGTAPMWLELFQGILGFIVPLLIMGGSIILSIIIIMAIFSCVENYVFPVIVIIALMFANVNLYFVLYHDSGIIGTVIDNYETYGNKFVEASLYNESPQQSNNFRIRIKRKDKEKWITLEQKRIRKTFINASHEEANKPIYYFAIPADTELMQVTTNNIRTYLAGTVDYTKEKDSNGKYTFCYSGYDLFQYEPNDVKYTTNAINKITNVEKPESLPDSKQEPLLSAYEKMQNPNIENEMEIRKKTVNQFRVENENEMTYEQGFWLYMRTNYGSKFLDNEKAQKLYLKAYHPKDYSAAVRDQFVMHDRLSNIKTEMSEKFAEVITSKSNIYSVRVSAKFYEYDFDKKQYTLKINIPELNKNTKIDKDEAINYNEDEGVSISITDSEFVRKEEDFISTKIPMGEDMARDMKNKTFLAIIYYKPTYELINSKYLRAKITGYELYDTETLEKIK